MVDMDASSYNDHTIDTDIGIIIFVTTTTSIIIIGAVVSIYLTVC